MLLQCAMDDSPTMFKLVISKTRKKFMVDQAVKINVCSRNLIVHEIVLLFFFLS